MLCGICKSQREGVRDVALHLQDAGHECDRFGAQGLDCPFRKFPEDEDDPDDDSDDRFPVPIAIPARGRGEVREPLIFPHQQPEFVRRLEQMAAFQNLGELQSIPDVPGRFRLTGRGHEATMAGLTAIVIMQITRALRSSGFGNVSRVVRTSERQAARQLKGVTRFFSPGQGPLTGGGRGGFLVRESDFRQLLRRPKLGTTPAGGFDAFSETGFN